MAPPVAERAVPKGRPSVVGALRFAGPAFVEWLHALIAWNVIIVVLAALVLVPLAATGFAIAAVPLITLLLSPLLRLAAIARRDQVVSLAAGVAGVAQRTGAKCAVAGVTGVVLVLGALNLALLPALPDLVAGMVATVSLIATAAAAGVGLGALTLLNDPLRNGERSGALVRLSVAVLLRHPAAWLTVLMLATLAGLVVHQLMWPVLLVPAFGALVLAGLVLPAADLACRLVVVEPDQPSGSSRTKTRGRPARSSRTG